jgi:hypothetical protein
MLVALPVLLASACEPPEDLTLPTADQAKSYYQSVGDLKDVEVNGNVVVVVVSQPAEQLRRGGSLWARVGPYVYLFSDETQRLFNDFNGLAAVRVITVTGNGTTVANALLARDALTDVLWRRSLNIAGQARRDGTERITLIEDLIKWGEDHTEHEYNQRYVPRR